MNITPGNPILLADEHGPKKSLRVILFREPIPSLYAIVIGDCIRHVAKACKVTEQEVLDLVVKEVTNPTAEIVELDLLSQLETYGGN